MDEKTPSNKQLNRWTVAALFVIVAAIMTMWILLW
jgi:hypothetical protein